MISDSVITQLGVEVRDIYTSDPRRAAQRIEAHLKDRLSDQSSTAAKAVLRRLIEQLRMRQKTTGSTDSQVLTQVFSLLLGRKVEPDDLSSTEFLERLAQSLNTIFNALNQLISVINMSFTGGHGGDQTIRQFIGYHLEGADQTKPLEEYLGQINRAFLMTHEAFKKTVQTKVQQILQSLDPDLLAAERTSGLKIGPLRKAENFDILKEKIERIQKWFDSGRFMEDFLREFENNCQTFKREGQG
jgi:uncharacterized protein (DUF2267 family)